MINFVYFIENVYLNVIYVRTFYPNDNELIFHQRLSTYL